jgi:hypothetical protein
MYSLKSPALRATRAAATASLIQLAIIILLGAASDRRSNRGSKSVGIRVVEKNVLKISYIAKLEEIALAVQALNEIRASE